MTIEDRLRRIEVHLGFSADPAPKSPLAGHRIAVVRGHHRNHDLGAVSADGMSEVRYNAGVMRFLVPMLTDAGAEVVTVASTGVNGYTASVDEMARRIQGCEAGIELHFNSYDGSADQEEYLYWGGSVNGSKLAKSLIDAHRELDPNPKSRGIKPISSERARGGYALRKTPCPYVICEPFFGDNPQDWDFWKDNQELLAQIYFNGLEAYFA